ncbi:MAG: hypothetical protein ACK5IQ_01645 [Bacteroidales bacterium]
MKRFSILFVTLVLFFSCSEGFKTVKSSDGKVSLDVPASAEESQLPAALDGLLLAYADPQEGLQIIVNEAPRHDSVSLESIVETFKSPQSLGASMLGEITSSDLDVNGLPAKVLSSEGERGGVKMFKRFACIEAKSVFYMITLTSSKEVDSDKIIKSFKQL